jgi:hypothetical protein
LSSSSVICGNKYGLLSKMILGFVAKVNGKKYNY